MGVLTYAPLVRADYKVIGVNHNCRVLLLLLVNNRSDVSIYGAQTLVLRASILWNEVGYRLKALSLKVDVLPNEVSYQLKTLGLKAGVLSNVVSFHLKVLGLKAVVLSNEGSFRLKALGLKVGMRRMRQAVI